MKTVVIKSSVINALNNINVEQIEEICKILIQLRKNNGRLFLIGSGGGAGHASHACADFRKLCGIEAYAPYDNVSELTARVNDESYEMSIIKYLETSNFNANDCLFVFSVGGGTPDVSANIYHAVNMAFNIDAKVIGIIGNDNMAFREKADCCIMIESDHPKHPFVNYRTPITEGLQAVLWHIIVENIKINETVW